MVCIGRYGARVQSFGSTGALITRVRSAINFSVGGRPAGSEQTTTTTKSWTGWRRTRQTLIRLRCWPIKHAARHPVFYPDFGETRWAQGHQVAGGGETDSFSSWSIFTAQCTLVHLRGLGIACRPSVCLSVRLSVTLVICDHTGWKSWQLIARTISPAPSLFVAKRRSTYSQGNMGKFGGD